jgi:hypothetical protein
MLHPRRLSNSGLRGKTVWETARETLKLAYEGKSVTLLEGPRP